MGLLQLMFFVFLLDSTVSSKISVQAPTCGNNTFFIQYPFKLLQEGQIPHHISPYDLKCNRQGVVALNLPFSGEFFVRNIDYFQQKIQLYDPSSCLPKRLKNLSLSSSPFVAVSYQKYTFFSCPLDVLSSRNFTEIRCLRNSTASVVATSETSTMDEIKNLTSCVVSYSLQVPVSQVSDYLYNGIDGDLKLSWIDPSSKGESRGKTSSKPGSLTIILICAVIVSTALLVSLFCIGCGISVIVVMLDVEETSYGTSWCCSTTRVWEMARVRLSGSPRRAAAPLNEVSFMSPSPSLQQPPTSDQSSLHPFSYYLSSIIPSSPEVPRGAEAPLAVALTPSSPDQIPSMAAPNDDEPSTSAAPPNNASSAISSTQQAPTEVDESAPSSPSIPDHEDELFLDAATGDEPSPSVIISSPPIPAGNESSSTPPPTLPQPDLPFDYFFTFLRVADETIFSTPLRPSTDNDDDEDDFSVIHSPPHPDTNGDDELFRLDIEVPTEDIIIGGSECIFGPNGESCTICLGEYKAAERLRLIRKCNHCFHAECLDQWLGLHRKTTCPVCRTNVI